MKLETHELKYIAKHFNMEVPESMFVDDELRKMGTYEESVATDIGEYDISCFIEIRYNNDGDVISCDIDQLEIGDSEEILELSEKEKQLIISIIEPMAYQNN